MKSVSTVIKSALFFLICNTVVMAQGLYNNDNIATYAKLVAQRRQALLNETISLVEPASAILISGSIKTPTAALQHTELRASNIPPVALSKTVQRLSPDQQISLMKSISDEISLLNEELAKRLAMEPKTPDINIEIAEINESITAKRQSFDFTRAAITPMSNAAAESFAAEANPFFLICGSSFWARKDTLNWAELVKKNQDKIISVGRSVGMVELNNKLIGTAFVVGKSHVLTNLHVTRDIADYDEKKKLWIMRSGAKISFDVEYPLGNEYNCPTANVKRTYYINGVFLTPSNMKDDIAILLTSSDENYPSQLEVKTRPNDSYVSNMLVAVLGYPGPPRDMTIAEQISFFTGPTTGTPQFVYKRISGGYTGDEIVDSDGMFVHKANTARGSSGSPILDLADGSVVGIHVEGSDRNRFNDVLGYNRGLIGERVRTLLIKAGFAK